jgi:photosystem II stability/assembly factor-like uncharacterized protein
MEAKPVQMRKDRNFALIGALGLMLVGSSVHADWEVLPNPGVGDLSHAVFKSQRQGWAVSGSGIIHTSDGGRTWVIQLDTTWGANDMDFADTLIGVAVGYERDIQGFRHAADFATTDGGLTWVYNAWPPVRDPPSSWYTVCRFATPQVLWVGAYYVFMPDPPWGGIGAVGQPSLGGDWWRPIGLATAGTRPVWSVWEEIGYERKMIYMLPENDTWVRVNDSLNDVASLDFVTETRGWLLGQHALIMTTTDAGYHWTVQYEDSSATLNDLQFLDTLNGWAVGDDGLVLRTHDGGVNWVREVLPPRAQHANLRAVCFVDTCDGWAVGDSGSILHYSPLVGTVEQPARPESRALSLVCRPEGSGWRISVAPSWLRPARLVIFDLAGREVWSACLEREQDAVKWEGRDANRRLCPHGVYFCRAEVSGRQVVSKLPPLRVLR